MISASEAIITEAMIVICDECEAYGYRRVAAELRRRGMVVNSKKVRRLMRENGLQPKNRRRFVATTDSDREGPFFPDLVCGKTIDGPDQSGSSPTSPSRPASFTWLQSSMLGRVGWSLRDQPLDGCGTDRIGAESRYEPVGRWFA